MKSINVCSKIKKYCALFCALIILLATGCAKSVALPVVPTKSIPRVTPEITPDPNEVDASLLTEKFWESIRFDVILINNYSMEIGYDNAADIIASMQRYILKRNLLNEQFFEAGRVVESFAKDKYDSVTMKLDLSIPSWQYFSVILPEIKDEHELQRVLGLNIRLVKTETRYELFISNSPADLLTFIQDCANRPNAVENTYIDLRFTYAYLVAVYNEKGEVALKKEYDFKEDNLNEYVFPLSIRPKFYDTWGDGRSQNTRRHMGTDILVDEGTEILSCCDGTVVAIGTAKIPGNYVIVVDEHGYEFHYYHMVEVSTLVSVGETVLRGQQIGNVGNTGNSDANHLHLTIVDPNGVFCNPYNMLVYLSKKV